MLTHKGKAFSVLRTERNHAIKVGILIVTVSLFLQPLAAEISDAKITTAVYTSLNRSEAVPSHLIDASSQDGIVTLSGSVSSILARDRAIKITKSLRGVRAVINQIDIRPVMRTDNEIRVDVINALLVDPATDSYEIRVFVDTGTVTLQGTVQSWAEKELAATVTKGVAGVRKINNNLEIQYDEKRNDNEIKLEIEKKLSLDPYVNDSLLEVRVSDGTVVLRGSVGTALQKTYAYNNCWVAGVHTVNDSRVKVNAWVKDDMKKYSKFALLTDKQIQQAVTDALLWDPRTYSFMIEVAVNNNVVTLSGVVDNLKARRIAEQDARNTVSVVQVNNYIRVRPRPISDRDIEQNLNDAFRRDAIVERHELSPVVRNQKVYLYGNVDSYFEKFHAEDVATRINGVAVVSNQISVNGEFQDKSDLVIKNQIESELWWDWYIEEENVTVAVDDGMAVLSGTVKNNLARDDAIEDAFDGGAEVVESQLKIKGRNNNEIFRVYKTGESSYRYYLDS